MKRIGEIIREQLKEEEYIQQHEIDILQYYILRSGLAQRKKPASAKWDDGSRRIMKGSEASS